MKHCDVCERDIHRSSFANQLRNDGPLLKTGERIKCDICQRIVEATEFQKHLVNEGHKMIRTKGLRKKPEVKLASNISEKIFVEFM